MHLRKWYDAYGAFLRRLGRLRAHGPDRDTPRGGSAPIGNLPELGPLPARTCDAGDPVYGYGFLDRWQSACEELYEPVESSPAPTTVRIRSIVAPGTPVATHPHVVCDATNLRVDYGRIGRRDELRHRPGYLRAPQAYPDYGRGALSGHCRPRGGGVDLERFPRDHLRDAFDGFTAHARPGELAAPDAIVEHPVLFVTREPGEHANLYHAHTDFLAAYQVLHMFGWSGDETQVVLMDNHPPGPFDEVFRRAFSRRHRVLRPEDYAGRAVLYRRAVFVPPGYSSFLFAHLWDEDPGAGRVGMLVDYGRFLLAAFGVARPPAGEPVSVTLISRRPYRSVVDRRYLRGQIEREVELTEALSRLPGVRVETVDFAALPFGEQLRVAARSEILVGAHGAGLAHLLCMAEHGAALEIVGRAEQCANRMFAHLATWSGREMRRLPSRERYGLRGTYLRVDAAALTDTVRAVADRVRERRPRADEPSTAA
jgi:hypothetical protein